MHLLQYSEKIGSDASDDPASDTQRNTGDGQPTEKPKEAEGSIEDVEEMEEEEEEEYVSRSK